MDERVEEIRAIKRISPVRKVALARQKGGRHELMYQLNQQHESQNPKRKPTDSGAVLNSDNFVADLKKRIAFDRAMIIGE
ncbi:MAG: hypothetical protein P4L59_05445 [Desulfosporosinus sp.]|nr:hypothetical protein [Desulfosporosinus sp.]